MLQALFRLGVTLAVSGQKSKGRRISKERAQRPKDHGEQASFAAMRYYPVLKDVMTDLARGSLDEDKFPYVKAPPPAAARKVQNNNKGRSRFGGRSARGGPGRLADGDAAEGDAGGASPAVGPSPALQPQPKLQHRLGRQTPASRPRACVTRKTSVGKKQKNCTRRKSASG